MSAPPSRNEQFTVPAGWDYVSVHSDPGWSIVKQNAPGVVTLTRTITTTVGWGSTPSPASTLDSSQTRLSDSDQGPMRMRTQVYLRYRKRNYKGSAKLKDRLKEKDRIKIPIPKESEEENRMKMTNVTDMRQKSWNPNGKSVAEAWAKSLQLRTYVRNLTLDAVTALLNTFKLADIDFQQKMQNINYENWHDTIDNTFFCLHKDLGMPIRLMR
jgi:hypothetical protein